ncbi:type II toxin-antitoxin system RelE/ParE family toxin [Sphingopyxis indica]|uniref:type II toxin-antitoxin system RelE family toxin n=1 Tax=Sphingopyxis indica TaxID=436663 RepID=UPI0029390664|nr:type II toxin-antitoxin system RelE/ParE family toxin [Sphingopyxis indica]WOF42865.1 type II toxin-antitoxin system RelE/ParE family toxin [Sphingopyxis indica]
MTTYKLEFFEDAKKEWDRLDSTIRSQFRKKLQQRLEHPHVASVRLHGLAHCYKIKLRSAGYRLIYQVEDDILIVAVVAIGKRERDEAYKAAARRL